MRSARTRMRVPILVVLPVLAAQLSPLKIQTAAHAPPPDFWWDDKPPAVECPPPIHPDEWLIVPKGAAFGPTQVFLRYLLDPSGDPPSIGTERTGEDLWQSVRARSLPSAVAAYTCIGSERDEVRMARLSGAEMLFVNGDAFVGDSGDRGHRGVPVALRKGDNHLFVLGINGAVELELWIPETRAVLASWDVAWPGEIPTADDFAYPVFNASTEIGEHLHVHYGHAVVEGSSCPPAITDWRCGGSTLPLGVTMAGSYFTALDEKCDPSSDEQVALVPICVYFAGDRNPDQRILRRGPASQIGRSGNRRTSRSMSAIAGSPMTRLPAHTSCLLYGKGGLERARFDQQMSWYRTWIAPEVVAGGTFASTPALRDGSREESKMYWLQESCEFVVYGNADTNPAWEKFIPSGTIEVRNGSLRIGASEFRGDDICGWFAYKRSREQTVVVIADTGERGKRLGYLVQPLFLQAEGLDYAFWDAGGEGGCTRLIASGKFPF